MRRAIHIGLFLGTLIGMCACAAAPQDYAAARGFQGAVGIDLRG
jgi:hypothetical protein